MTFANLPNYVLEDYFNPYRAFLRLRSLLLLSPSTSGGIMFVKISSSKSPWRKALFVRNKPKDAV